MITKSQAKRKQDIKTKLMAAIAMLLVSSIMMVSSTYAWFTLSTAPEVTGITTAVGANGNLEMALLPKTGVLTDITSAAGDNMLATEAKNVTWGNLVDLGDTNVYGLDKITLYPSKLNITEAGNIDISGFLMTPEYGADGRVSVLANKSVTSYYDAGAEKFTTDNDDYGVRAIGTASGMTDRQLDYRNARSAANTAKALAATLASQSLTANGSALANIAITHGMGNDTGKYTEADVAALDAIITDLEKDGGVLDQIEKAYMQYILAYAASSLTGTDDTVWTGVKSLVNADNATLASVKEGLGADVVAALPGNINAGIAKYEASVASVAKAKAALAPLKTEAADESTAATFDWSEISAVMQHLANPSNMTVNGFETSEVKANLGALVSSVTQQGGLIVTISSGGGVYADIADQSGNYSASVKIERVEYNGIVLENMDARMNTATNQNPPFLVGASSAVEGKAPAGTSTGAMALTDMYGYIIDLAFRTNAATSNLLLQREAKDRIYSDNTNEQTMGHGSSMTFNKTDSTFSDNQLVELMKAIKIVFFNPNGGEIYCYAELDAANATLGADGWTAKMKAYTVTTGATTYTTAEYSEDDTETYYKRGEDKEVYTEYTGELLDNGQYYLKQEDGSYVLNTGAYDTTKAYYTLTLEPQYIALTAAQAAEEAGDGTQLYKATKAADGKVYSDEIMPLTQNTAHALSVLVYLDGEEVTNADVAATASTSMTGKMNLQFASTANLTPMEYKDLHIEGSGTTTGGTTGNTETVSVALTGVEGNATATKNTAYTFTLADGYQAPVTVKVGETDISESVTESDGTYTIPAASVTGNITIVATATP